MAAGLGFKTFNTGDILSASDVNGYLMQGVLVFASTAARDAAITAPAEGQFAFTKDTNSLFYYDGAAWVASGATGDIEGVTAGTGISGGGTSGTVTITNSMATAIDAKGDLIVGTGADTFSKLTAGTNGYVLTADSAEATGLKWAAAAGGGKVLQVLNLSLDAPATTSSATPSSTGLSLSITPSSATSKILIFGSINGLLTTSGSCRFYLYKGASSIKNITSAGIVLRSASITFLDSPATTSATTYAIYFSTSAGTAYINDYVVASGDTTSQITVMEIGA
jgi:hypothetical protein